MQILSTGGTMSAIEEQPETIVEHLNALWDNQNNRPIPTDIRWEDYAPEKVMLRFKDELKRLQPYVEGWFSERGKSLPDWPKLYFVPVEGWINYFKAHPDAARLPKGPTRDEWIASRVLYLSALCPWRYTQGIFRFAPSFAKALCSSSLKGDIPCEVFLRLPQWSIYVETPKTRYDNSILVGFWAHLQNRDITMEKPALKLLLNMVNETGGSFLSSIVIPLEPMTLEAYIKDSFEGWLTNPLTPEDEAALHVTSADHQALYRSEEVREAFYAHSVERMRPILAMLLYLCTTEPDIVSNRKPGLKPANNEGRHVKKGFRLFPAEGPHIWNVGQSMENDMAKHYRVVHDESQSLPSDKKREVRSHVRSAHWHGYWKGRRPKAEEKDMREFIFHWIPPLLVRGSRDVEPVKRSAKAQSHV
jgi:hypothetical protein